MDVKNIVLGSIFFLLGIFLFYHVSRDRKRGQKGGYGAHIEMYFSAIGFIVLGLFMIIQEIR